MNANLMKILSEPDELATPEIGHWSIRKHELLEYYADIFSSSMRNIWNIVYLDLFASAGKARLKDRSVITPGSPLRALAVKSPFHRYVFCEADPGNAEALRARVDRHFPDRSVEFYQGDANREIDRILQDLAKWRNPADILTLCFLDPYKAADLKFETIRKITRFGKSDFFVLLPTAMDVNRNELRYSAESSRVVDDLLGQTRWRGDWAKEREGDESFGYFVTKKFGEAMSELGFPFDAANNLVRMGAHGFRASGLTYYYLGLFSRAQIAAKFWRYARAGVDDQIQMDL